VPGRKHGVLPGQGGRADRQRRGGRPAHEKRRGRAPGSPATGPNPAAYRPSREQWTNCAKCRVAFQLKTKAVIAGERPNCPACNARLAYRLEDGRLMTERR